MQADVLKTSTVFTAGENGYTCFRIPTLVKANDGTLLAFAEGRVNSCSDFGNIDMVLKRSTDGGRTWGPIQFIDSNGNDRSHSAAPVVDTNTGDIVLPFMRGDQPFVRRSTNNGLTWTGPSDISAQIFPGTWSSMGFGPVHGIQLEQGPNAGRLVVPAKHILDGQPLEPSGREAHVIYSDDGGVNWSVGANFTNPTNSLGPNEATVVELNDGRLFMSTRNQGGGARNRLVGISPDGIQNFDGDPNDGVISSVVETSLADAQVQGSLLRASANRIIHTHIANDTTDRYHLSISSSFDETATWKNRKLIHRTLAAYSDLVNVQGNEIGMIYEAGSTGSVDDIRFGWFDEEWLDDPTAVHYDFDAANLSNIGGVNKALSVGGFDYDGQAFLSMTQVAGSSDYQGDGALRFSQGNVGDTLRLLEATDASNLEFEHEDSFTIEAVFKTSAHAADTGVIFEKSENGNSNGEYSIEIANGKLRFHLRDLAGNQANLLSTADLNDGDWHHVAAVRDAGLQRLILYIDHQFAGTVVDLTPGDLGDISLGQAEVPFIGSGADGLDEFAGDLQHLRISMAALSPGQFLQKLLLSGDLDGDGFVGINDLNIVLSNWNQNVPPGDPAADPSGDGFVGIDDLNEVLGNWNAGTPPSANTVPEPSTMTLLISAVCASIGRRTRAYPGAHTNHS